MNTDEGMRDASLANDHELRSPEGPLALFQICKNPLGEFIRVYASLSESPAIFDPPNPACRARG
jgi:hypothetical protein